MHQQTKNFTFKEENSKCNLHQELNRFICKCGQKFCMKCLTENKDLHPHFKIHSDYKLFHIKNLKTLYVNQLEDIENLIKEISDGNEENSSKEKEKKKLFNESFALRELKSNLKHLINFSVDKYFESVFKQEEKVLEEMIKVTNSSDIVLDSDGVINSFQKLINLKKNGKLSAISTFEKMNSVQNSFLGKIDMLLQEFEILMKKYFGSDGHYNFQIDDLNSKLEMNLKEKIIPPTYLEHKNRSLDLNSNDIPTNVKEIEKYMSDCESTSIKLISKENISEKKLKKTLVLNLNLNISSSSHKDFKLYNLEDIPDSHNSKISVLNTIANFTEEANIFTNSNFKNIQSNSLWKDGIIPEFSGSVEDISYCMKSNKIKQRNLSDSSMDIDNKSFITEFNINKENRNRINKIIFYKKQRRIENLHRSPKNNAKKKYQTSHFQRISDHATPTNFNNFNPAYGFPTKGFALMPKLNTDEIQNDEGDYCQVEACNSKLNALNRLCVDCFTPYNVKNASTWKKRCTACQKTKYEKVTNTKNFYSVNSYKAGKMNQTCLKCKNIFIVPVALAKQRKTCYYCFKNNINN